MITFISIIICFSSAVSLASEISPVEFRDLSDTDITPQGKSVLAMNPESWQHAETEHFVYHFTDAKDAETVYKHSEVYYQWVKEMFGITEDHWRKKAHVFVFEDKGAWQNFNKKLGPGLEGDAFTNGWELFIWRNPFWLSPKKTLAHELTHVILFRFLDGPIPLFLNEGFAEFVSYKALALHADGNEYRVHTIQLVPESDFVPLKNLIGTTSYPSEPKKVQIFYRESELLTRFLIVNYDSKKFYALLRDVSKGRSFEEVAEEIYGIDFPALEEKFKTFAVSHD